jgi:hypothetical protein
MPEPLGLMVVHGIGDPLPGETIRDFTDTLDARGVLHFTNHVEDHRLVDAPASRPDKFVFFPAHLRHGTTAAGASLIAAEVFWGSASRLGPGRLGVVQGLVSILVDIPSLVHAAYVRESPAATRLVYQCCAWLSMLLASAAFALNALLLAAFGVMAGAYVGGLQFGSSPDVVVTVLAAVLVAALGYVPWIRFVQTRRSLWVVGLLSILLARFALGELTLRTSGTTAAFALVAIVAAAAALLIFGAVVYVVGQWLVSGRHRSTETCLLAAFMQFGAWTLIVPVTWRALFYLAPARLVADNPWITDLYAAVAPADGLQWVMLGAVLAATLVVVVVRWRHARAEATRLRQDPHHAVPAPRFIVNWIIGLTVALATTLGAAAVLATTADGALAHQSWLGAILLRIPEAPWTIVAVALFYFAFEPVRVGLDLVNDIVSYLYYRCDSGRSRAWSRAAPSSDEDPTRLRFRAVLTYLVRECKVAHLTVVAHSQGTIIALDELRAWEGDLPPVTLVTCGSPATHLYQFYFPDLCHDFADPIWAPLFGRLDRWVNLYRLSDYVGTIVETPPLAQFDQWAIGEGGHIGYWTHPAFADAIARANIF